MSTVDIADRATGTLLGLAYGDALGRPVEFITSVNRCGDTDILGAVTGSLAGARFGADALPSRWFETLEYREDLTLLGQALAPSQISD